jgi:uncharacterized protein
VALDVKVILNKYFQGEALAMVITHGSVVSALSGSIGRTLGLPAEELLFLEQAAMLHDIGICRINAPEIGMHGQKPYIMHGVLGREILEVEGFPRHALVCERHIGVGLTEADIINQGLPLPIRDMTPQNITEEIVCFADLYFSKKPDSLERMKTVENVRQKLAEFGERKLQIFDSWLSRFGAVLKNGATYRERSFRSS